MNKEGFDVNYVAKLAHIELSAEESEVLGGQLRDIISYVEKLKELDVSDVEPTLHCHDRVNAFREDEVTNSSLDRDDVLQNAPDRTETEFKLPKIVEDA